MLKLQLETQQLYDEEKEEFLDVGGVTVWLEHSLFSVSKWESEFHKPFLGDAEKTEEELLGYAYHMIAKPEVEREIIFAFTDDHMQKINDYVTNPMTATTFGEMPKAHGPKETITSELVYYWMVAYKIPMECQHWHLNRLFSLIKICNVKNAPPKKMSKSEIAQRNRELNERRRAELGTKG